MEENKYYVPEIEEFHVGFEYETKVGGNDLLPIDGPDWLGVTYPDPFIGESINRIKDLSGFRVKYLDKEDIESLGFKGQEANTVYFKKSGYRLVHWPDKPIRSLFVFKVYPDGDEVKIFEGVIKNKSELKRLMKQIGIK